MRAETVAVGGRQPQHHYYGQVCGGQMQEKDSVWFVCYKEKGTWRHDGDEEQPI